MSTIIFNAHNSSTKTTAANPKYKQTCSQTLKPRLSGFRAHAPSPLPHCLQREGGILRSFLCTLLLRSEPSYTVLETLLWATVRDSLPGSAKGVMGLMQSGNSVILNQNIVGDASCLHLVESSQPSWMK